VVKDTENSTIIVWFVCHIKCDSKSEKFSTYKDRDSSAK